MADIGSTAVATDPRLKARLYEELDVEVTYDASSDSQRVRVSQNVSEGGS